MTCRTFLFLLVFLSAAAMSGCGGADSEAEEGRLLASRFGCSSCHSTDGSASVGPTWKGLYGSVVRLDDGSSVVADNAYLRESMLEPSAKTVKGFQKGRMETVIRPNSLSDEQVKALISYIGSLR